MYGTGNVREPLAALRFTLAVENCFNKDRFRLLICWTRFGSMWITHEGASWGSLCYIRNSSPLCLLFMGFRGHLTFGIWVANIFRMRLCGDGQLSFNTHFEWGHLTDFYLPISQRSPLRRGKAKCTYKINPADSFPKRNNNRNLDSDKCHSISSRFCKPCVLRAMCVGTEYRCASNTTVPLWIFSELKQNHVPDE